MRCFALLVSSCLFVLQAKHRPLSGPAPFYSTRSHAHLIRKGYATPETSLLVVHLDIDGNRFRESESIHQNILKRATGTMFLSLSFFFFFLKKNELVLDLSMRAQRKTKHCFPLLLPQYGHFISVHHPRFFFLKKIKHLIYLGKTREKQPNTMSIYRDNS